MWRRAASFELSLKCLHEHWRHSGRSKRDFRNVTRVSPIPAAARSKAWFCGCSLFEIVGSNPTGGMHVCLLWVLGVVRYSSLRQADHSFRGVLPSVVCLSVILKSRKRGGLGPLGGCCTVINKIIFSLYLMITYNGKKWIKQKENFPK